jgi:hypothetical protein
MSGRAAAVGRHPAAAGRGRRLPPAAPGFVVAILRRRMPATVALAVAAGRGLVVATLRRRMPATVALAVASGC